MNNDERVELLTKIVKKSSYIEFEVPKLNLTDEVNSALIDLANDYELFVSKENINEFEVKITVGFKHNKKN